MPVPRIKLFRDMVNETAVRPACFSRFRAASSRAAFSLPEILVVVGVIAVLAAIMIPTMLHITESAEETTAEANVEMLNQALLKYSQSASELTNSVSESISDEREVVDALKVRDTSVVGSPFLNGNFTVTATSDESVYRAVWNGRMFQLLTPGTEGTGMEMVKAYQQ